jgi:hypothetical protein
VALKQEAHGQEENLKNHTAAHQPDVNIDFEFYLH